jgi:hypothetical protein
LRIKEVLKCLAQPFELSTTANGILKFTLIRCYVSGLKKKKREGKMFLKNFILKCL